jgi:hypothetical protein
MTLSNTSNTIVGGALVLGAALAAVTWLRPAAAQPQQQAEGAIDQYRTMDLPVGKFVYRFLFDTATGEHWLWVNGDWERPEPPKDGYPWQKLKPRTGRFQMLPQVAGDIDAELYILDTTSGRVWARPARNRAQLFSPDDWREITLPGRAKK